MNYDLLGKNNYLLPPVIKEAAEANGMTVPELFEKAAASYDDFLERGADLNIQYLEMPDTMEKKASMEKLSEMDKQAIVLTGTLGAAMALGFGGWSAYDFARNMWGGGKDILKGNFGSALKRIPSAALDAIGTMSGATALGKGGKLLSMLSKAKKAGKFKQGLKLIPGWQQAVAKGKLAPTMFAKGEKLKKGKFLWSNPKTWFMNASQRAKEAGKYKLKGNQYISKADDFSKQIDKVFGRGAGKFKRVEGGDVSLKRALTGKGANTGVEVPAYDMFHNDKLHKKFMRWDALDNLGVLRMAPLPIIVGGAALKSPAMMNLGTGANNIINYYGPEDTDERRAARAQYREMARQAARTGGYLTGYGA